MSGFATKEELVARYVREAIVAGRLVPGQRLLLNQLADELGVSATPVREAVRGLVTEGWLKSESHVGVSVAEINREGTDEIYRLRALLEGDLAALAAAQLTDSGLREIRRINENYRQAADARDVAGTRAVNLQFHAAIWEAAKSPTAVRMLNFLWARAPRPATAALAEDRHMKTIAEHELVIEALASRDPERARQALGDHIRSGQTDFNLSANAGK